MSECVFAAAEAYQRNSSKDITPRALCIFNSLKQHLKINFILRFYLKYCGIFSFSLLIPRQQAANTRKIV